MISSSSLLVMMTLKLRDSQQKLLSQKCYCCMLLCLSQNIGSIHSSKQPAYHLED